MTLPPAASLHQGAESFYQRWQRLNDWLVQHREFWQPAPFMTPEPAWAERYPQLATLVAELSDDDCNRLDECPEVLAEQASRWLPSLADYSERVELPELSPSPGNIAAATLPEIRATDMPGRKRQQAGAFAAALVPLTEPALDWCCGKGHLSRTLAPLCPGEVQGLEWNPELVADGNRLARHFGDRVSIRCQDVMAPGLALASDRHGIALHACGDLHRRLLAQGSRSGLPRLSLSPCCYHLTDQQTYRPLSARAQAHPDGLELDRNDLRLAVQETVTAPARVREHTRIVSQWRLGFDGLQRELRGQDTYLPVPPHPAQLMSQGFPAFCRWAANKKRLTLPDHINFDVWLAFGERRLERVRRYELVRHLFRRPLELWVVRDYAVFLEEQGYRVRLGAFCQRSLTPRNLLLDAVRVCGTPPARHSRP